MSVQNDTSSVRTSRLELRLSVQERERIEAKAKLLGMSLSDYIRTAALGFAEPQQVVIPTTSSISPLDHNPPPSHTFKCPVQPACPFRALSGAARCPVHGRQVIPG